jgi:hypothetical protein
VFYPQPCGVDYELKTYVSESAEEKPHKRLMNGRGGEERGGEERGGGH